jgi:phosphinothricin acetyltransferase
MQPEGTASTRPRVVAAERRHLPEVAEIYAEVVRTSHATFDIEAPDLGDWEQLLEHADPEAGHFLVVALDAMERVLGYAKSGRFKEKGAYWSTCEVSTYVAADARAIGVGTALYESLFELLDASQLGLATAGVAEPNPASTALHRAFGFEPVGTFHGVGVKFDRAWDVTWYERPLG